MDPVQYVLHLLEQGKSYEDAYSHAAQRFGESKAQIEQRILDARSDALRLVRAIDNLGALG